jgi:hypothetical protein
MFFIILSTIEDEQERLKIADIYMKSTDTLACISQYNLP